jgi:serine/threonine protein kinase
MLELEGYQFKEMIHDGKKSVVYRGVRKADDLPVIAKVLRAEYPSLSELERLENGYRIARELDSPGIVKPSAGNCSQGH